MRRLLLIAVVCVGCSLDAEGTAEPTGLVEDTGSVVVEQDSMLVVDSTIEDSAAIDTTLDDSAAPLDTMTADTAMPDTAMPDTAMPDTAMPDTTMPDTTMPDTAMPDTAMPDTAVADTARPDTGSDAETCVGTNATKYGGHCYFAITTARTWSLSRDRCAELGAHLVTITSSGEQTAIAGVGTGERWIGLTRASSSTGFSWYNGEGGGYRNWEPGEPNDSGNCARMITGGLWKDQGCDVTYAAICERDSL